MGLLYTVWHLGWPTFVLLTFVVAAWAWMYSYGVAQ